MMMIIIIIIIIIITIIRVISGSLSSGNGASSGRGCRYRLQNGG